MLDTPDDPEDLWLATDGVPVARPLMQGDVLLELPIGDGGGSAPGMILTHPCSMRAGKKLRPRQTVAQVVKQPIGLDQWAGSHYDYMPLPGVLLPDLGDGLAVDLRLISAVETAILVAAERAAALSDIGIHLLQQRLTHHLTRVVVDLATFAEHSAPTLLEVELQEDWVSDALHDLAPDADRTSVQRIAEDAFQDLLDANDRRLRRMLAEAPTRAQAAREIRLEIRRRRDDHDTADDP